MAKPNLRLARVSSKGQVYLPKALRDHLAWEPGVLLNVVEVEGGVLLSRLERLSPTKPSDVFSVLKRSDRHLSDQEFEGAVDAEARRRKRD